jgi:Ca2+-binding EF-hand superfamily protein
MSENRKNIFKFNTKLVRIFNKIDKKQRGFISKYQIQFNFPREECEDELKKKFVNCMSKCSNSSHYVDLSAFLELGHLLVQLGLHSMK